MLMSVKNPLEYFARQRKSKKLLHINRNKRGILGLSVERYYIGK